MDIPVVAIAIISALLLTRQRALLVVPVVWAIAVVMVGWGPAHNSNVHTDSASFWGPWLVLLALSCGLVFGITAWRERRGREARA